MVVPLCANRTVMDTAEKKMNKQPFQSDQAEV